jgi:putative pyruvate formate lyase activating enzyme
MPERVPAKFLSAAEDGTLQDRIARAYNRLTDCDLCARYCHVDRTMSLKGAICRTGVRAIIHSFGPHYGEEDPLRGIHGSGTIFFSHCNLRCVFCQNWEISHKGAGCEVSDTRLADMMIQLQSQGCHNINLVSPSHVVAQILAALQIAVERGLRIPLVYNSGGYDSPEALALLDGVVDIYMPDMKYGVSDHSWKFSRIRDYAQVNRAAVKEMYRQVGDLQINSSGIAQRGLLVRHLVMPGMPDETEAVLRFIADEISKKTWLNLMDQYRPCNRAEEYPPLDRALTHKEYESALEMARKLGLNRLDKKDFWFSPNLYSF